LRLFGELKTADLDVVIDTLATRDREAKISAVLICVQLVGAWKDRAFARGIDPTHNILVISLGNSNGERGELSASVISRVLGIPHVLPPPFNGGILFRDAIIHGPLVLNQISVDLPVTFTAARFVDLEYPRDAFNLPGGKYTITMFGPDFLKRVIFSDIEICGSFHIANAKFRESLYILNMTQLTEDCSTPASAYLGESKAYLKIERSNFDIGALFANMNVGRLSFDTNNLGHLVISGGLVQTLEVTQNSLISMNASGIASRESMRIGWNDVQSAMYFQNLQDRTAEPSDRESLKIISNRVGGGFYLLNEKNNWPPNSFDLSHNLVRGNAQIEMERSWSGDLDLSSTRFEAGLQIGLKREERWPIDEDRLNGVYCGFNPNPFMDIKLDWVEVKGLDWTFPMSCNIRWSGEGLSYGRWNGESFIDSAERSLTAWRTTLKMPNSDPLFAMSRYLSSHGSFIESRAIMIETKRLDYTNCAPHKSSFHCALSPYFEAESWIDGVLRTVTFWFLVPGGYGAQPERGLFCVVVGVAAFAILYGFYSEVRKRAYHRAVSSIERLLSDLGQVPISRLKLAELERVRKLDRDFRKILKFHPRNTSVKPSALEVDEQNQKIEAFTRTLVSVRGEFGVTPRKLQTKCLLPSYTGDSKTFGFSHFDVKIKPSKFTHFRYSLDTMLPVVYLHTYTNYYPESAGIRALAVFQHLLGWWWVTVFLASVAIL